MRVDHADLNVATNAHWRYHTVGTPTLHITEIPRGQLCARCNMRHLPGDHGRTPSQAVADRVSQQLRALGRIGAL